MYAEIVEKYRLLISDKPARPVSYRDFAERVNTYLRGGRTYGGPHWQAVAAGKYRPEYYAMRYLAETADGWVRAFAGEMLAAMEGE